MFRSVYHRMNIDFKKMKIESIIKLGMALNNSHRRKILLICEKNNYSISEIKKKIDLTYANTHKHIKILVNAGLIKTEETKNQNSQVVLVKPLYKITKDNTLEKTNSE